MSNTDTDNSQLTDSKSVLESRRAWGALTLAVPLLVQLSGMHLSAGETAQVAAAVDHAQAAFANLMAVFGALQMLIGAWNARAPLHVFKPYQVDDTGQRVVPVKPIDLTPDVARIMDDHPVAGAR